jgi:hypothetical protein
VTTEIPYDHPNAVTFESGGAGGVFSASDLPGQTSDFVAERAVFHFPQFSMGDRAIVEAISSHHQPGQSFRYAQA